FPLVRAPAPRQCREHRDILERRNRHEENRERSECHSSHAAAILAAGHLSGSERGEPGGHLRPRRSEHTTAPGHSEARHGCAGARRAWGAWGPFRGPHLIGAEVGTRTPTGCPTRPSNVRVCQFRHFGPRETRAKYTSGSCRRKPAPRLTEAGIERIAN